MKNFKYYTVIVLILSFMGIVFVGCGVTTKESAPTSTPITNASSPETTNPESTAPITITSAKWRDAGVVFRDGDTWENNIWSRMINEKLGVTVEDAWSTPDWASFEQKLLLNIAAGEPFPDVVFDYYNQGNPTLDKLVENSEILMPIQEAFDKYASPTVKKAYSLAPKSIWSKFTKDGKVYGLPILSDGIGNATTLIVRQDWLDAVGLPAPKTIDDLDKVLDAFTNNDPDKDGKKDTYGINFGWKDDFSTYLGDTSWLFGAYGAIPQIWTKGPDGKLAYGSIQPEVKDALVKLRDWYSKGYIDPQAALLNVYEAAKAKGFMAEKGGIVAVPQWGYNQIKDLFTNNPQAKVNVLPIPAGSTGKVARLGDSGYQGAFFFSKDFQNMEAFFEVFNLMYEKENPDNDEFKFGWIKDADYALDTDGNPLYGDDMKKVVPEGYYKMGNFMLGFESVPTVPLKYFNYAKELVGGATPSTPDELNWSKTNNPLAWNIMSTIYDQKDISVKDEYDGPVTKTQSTQWDQLKKKEHEVFLKIIYGQLPIEAYDQFVTDWKAQGGDDITNEVNEWYATVK
ncbi:hypothetical protein [Cohnella silvisoli]|uniref:Extracellular solute-binding protein n=1 Tax=Cohnella silvisoli TaxID=2873699 RepID=A0ABV1KQQ7_9BACL|nr:hypothetical protein [Cohnella silvisoli]MCD9024651.1 hypothetical protein [Cohnella silvisoli]